jgi:Tfp pilus assembly protein PilV
MLSTRTGFSLAETIVAMLVLSAGLLAVAHVVGLAERFGGRTRARTRSVFEVREAIARFQRADTVCATAAGSRRVGRTALTWVPGPAVATRLVTTVAEPAFQGAVAESAASVVACP